MLRHQFEHPPFAFVVEDVCVCLSSCTKQKPQLSETGCHEECFHTQKTLHWILYARLLSISKKERTPRSFMQDVCVLSWKSCLLLYFSSSGKKFFIASPEHNRTEGKFCSLYRFISNLTHLKHWRELKGRSLQNYKLYWCSHQCCLQQGKWGNIYFWVFQERYSVFLARKHQFCLIFGPNCPCKQLNLSKNLCRTSVQLKTSLGVFFFKYP